MVLSLAACGNQNGTTGEAETKGEAESNTSAAEKTYKEVITLGYDQPATTLDCQVLVNSIQDTLYMLYLNTLVNFNFETKQIEPCLATEWSHNEDSTVWTFKLRNDVTFSNGEPFTADDVVFTVERMAATGVSGAADAKNVEKVVANGDYEVAITLIQANMDLPYRLAMPFWGMLNREALEKDPDNGYKVGTGGWTPVKFEPGTMVEFDKVESSWVWKDVQTPTKKIIEKTMTEESARSIAVQTDEIQFSYSFNFGDINIYDADPNVDYSIISADLIYYLGMSYESEAIGDDVNLRNAIAYAIDPTELMDVGFSGKGEPCKTFWGPNQYGIYTDYEQQLGKNLDLAKEYLAKSNHPDGLTLSLTTVSAFEQMAEVVQAQLAEIGIEIKLNITDAPGLAQTVADKKLDLLLYSKTCGVYGDQFRDILVYGNTANRMKYNNEKVAELLDKALGETDDATRLALYKEVQEITHEEMPCVPLFYGTASGLFRKGLSGVIFQSNTRHNFTYAVCEESK